LKNNRNIELKKVYNCLKTEKATLELIKIQFKEEKSGEAFLKIFAK
jgi:hypothetical protein